MVDLRQKNLKLAGHSIELLRFLAYEENATESEVVEQALVQAIALKAARTLETANEAPMDDHDGDHVIETRYMVQRLQKYDPKHHWRVAKNQQAFWELQAAPVDELSLDDELAVIADEDWEPWPWPTNVSKTNGGDEIEDVEDET